MIRILDHTKALDVLANDTTNGLGKIEAVNKPLVTEELNGIYEAQFDVSIASDHFADLEVGGIVEINTSEGDQMFRIYQITKPINFISTVKCEHISYDLTRVVCLPFTATGATAACQAIVNAITGGTYPFTMTTNISNSSSTVRSNIPRTFRECLGGFEGSFLDAFRGEYKWDNLEVQMLSRRGSDQGVRISYGKNLTDFKQEENNASTYTGVIGYAIVDEQYYHGDVYHKVQATYPRIKVVDFSERYETGEVPTAAELTTLAQTYANANDIEVPSVNMTVSFVPLAQTEEYKNIAVLEDVYLGDTVHIYFEKLGVEASARVIKTVWNANTKRYDSITLGSYRSNMSSVIAGEIEQVTSNQKEATSFVQSEMNELATLIINGLGLHRTLVPKSNGGYVVYLHNGETLATSDTWYVMTANGFMVSTDYGQTWNAGFDSSGNAVLNSLATITLRALDIYGSRITFGDENDKYITAGVYTDSSDNAVGVSFDGSGYARFQPHEQFQVVNLDSSDDVLNDFTMAPESANSGGAQVSFTNYKADNTIANHMEMTAERNGASETYVNLTNNQYNSTSFASNISMLSNATNQAIFIQNRTAGSSYINNSLQMRAYASGSVVGEMSEIALRNAYNSNGNTASLLSLQSGTSTANVTAVAYDTSGSEAVRVALYSSGKLFLNGRTQFANASGTSASVTCSANNSGSTTVSVTIPTGYKAIAVANVKSNGNVVPAYTSSVFGMTGSQTLTVWWENGTNSAKTCTFTVDLLCAVDV